MLTTLDCGAVMYCSSPVSTSASPPAPDRAPDDTADAGDSAEYVDNGLANNEDNDLFGNKSCNDGLVFRLPDPPGEVGVDGPKSGLEDDPVNNKLGFNPTTGVDGALPLNGNGTGIGLPIRDLRTATRNGEGKSDCFRIVFVLSLLGVVGSVRLRSSSVVELGEPVDVDEDVRGGVLKSSVCVSGDSSGEESVLC